MDIGQKKDVKKNDTDADVNEADKEDKEMSENEVAKLYGVEIPEVNLDEEKSKED